MKAYTESEHNAAMDRLAADLSAKGAHTPRPWETLRLGKALYVQPVGGGFVCDMCLDDAEKKAQPTVYADASLIAAAPDLAEALRGLLANAEAVHSFGLPETVPPLTGVCFADAQSIARAALAKAGL